MSSFGISGWDLKSQPARMGESVVQLHTTSPEGATELCVLATSSKMKKTLCVLSRIAAVIICAAARVLAWALIPFALFSQRVRDAADHLRRFHPMETFFAVASPRAEPQSSPNPLTAGPNSSSLSQPDQSSPLDSLADTATRPTSPSNASETHLNSSPERSSATGSIPGTDLDHDAYGLRLPPPAPTDDGSRSRLDAATIKRELKRFDRPVAPEFDDFLSRVYGGGQRLSGNIFDVGAGEMRSVPLPPAQRWCTRKIMLEQMRGAPQNYPDICLDSRKMGKKDWNEVDRLVEVHNSERKSKFSCIWRSSLACMKWQSKEPIDPQRLQPDVESESASDEWMGSYPGRNGERLGVHRSFPGSGSRPGDVRGRRRRDNARCSLCAHVGPRRGNGWRAGGALRVDWPAV
jgi:hypothetical protein